MAFELLEERGGCSDTSENNTQNQDDVECRQRKWPPLIWFMMKVSAIFYHYRIVTDRLCITCEKDYYERRAVSGANRFYGVGRKQRVRKRKREEFDLTTYYEADISDQTPRVRNCKACETCWWDRNGDVVKFSDDSIGLRYWNHVGSWAVSILILASVAVLLMEEIIWIGEQCYAKYDLILNLLSYIGFVSPLCIFPVMNIYSKLRSAMFRRGTGIWATTLNARFIVHRLQFLNLAENGLPSKHFLVICFAWPVFAASYRTYIKLALKEQTDFRHHLSCLTVAIAEFIWGCFVYLLYLIRISFQIQFDLLLKYIHRFRGQAELCQQVIRRITVDYKCFRQCVVVYMVVMVPACVLGLATSTTWHYKVTSHRETGNKTADWYTTQRNISFMIWSDVAMFFLLGPIALGGFDVAYIWENFRINLTFMQCEEHRKFWEDILRLLRYVEDTIPLISIGTVLTFVSLYMAIQFGEQAEDF